MPSIQDIIDIPDVQECISQELNNHDLFTLSLVSKQWNSTFTRYLWRDLTKQRILPEQRRHIPSDGLARHGHHVRRMNIRHYEELDNYKPYCHHVRTLDVLSADDTSPYLGSFHTSLLPFLQTNRTTLTNLLLSFPNIDLLPIQPLHMPHLRDLWLLSDHLTCQHITMFLDHCPSLRHLCATAQEPIEVVPEAFQQDTYKLEEFTNDGYTPRHWDLTLFLWQRCPRMQSFTIPETSDPQQLEQFEQALRMHPSKNRALDILLDEEEEIVSLVEACPMDTVSKLLTLGDLHVTDLLWNELVRKQMGSLTLLDLSECTFSLPEGSVQTVLCSCRTLKYFDVVPTDDFDAHRGMPTASDVARGQWVCLDIELLRFAIVGMCNTAGPECEHHSKQREEIKQGVLQQLLRLTKLHTLGICHIPEGSEGDADSEEDTDSEGDVDSEEDTDSEWDVDSEEDTDSERDTDSAFSWPIGHVDGLQRLKLLEILDTTDREVLASQHK
ncbi:hypothetical protein DFQ27_005194 [Actinomortierella ambigua]|uniref:F-box domain-containing protein n=1 Tax=Actinomortierella ambigua TaxID=1343610 RepID=A0A9P6PZQ8_9FUNG|nr:hypothetical protein DFQ27_005194 [Actinomortierella ambigua]